MAAKRVTKAASQKTIKKTDQPKRGAGGDVELVASGAVTIRLADPGMTPLLRAGLGGLASTIWAAGREKNRSLRWPARIAIGDATYGVESQALTIEWGKSGPHGALKELFAHAFRTTKDGFIDLPGAYDPADPPSPELRAALQAALKKTFLQHGKTTKKIGSPRACSFVVDEQPIIALYQPYAWFAHQDAWEKAAEALSDDVELAGWVYPGATQRHVAFADTKQQYRFAEALCALFSIVGTLSYDIPRSGGGGVVILEPADLIEFARTRGRLSPRRVGEVHLSGIGDAVLLVELALRAEKAGGRSAVRATNGVLLRATPWATQQKTRVETIRHDSFNDELLTIYAELVELLPTKLRMPASAQPTKRQSAKPKVKKDTAGEETGYFAVTSALRGFVANNLASGVRWYASFATATTAEKTPRFIHYYRDAQGGLGALWFEERKGLQAMTQYLDDAERTLVRSVHIALKHRFGAIGEDAKQLPEATRRNRFESERDRWRHAFSGAKTGSQIRAALADLWSRAAPNRELENNWEKVLPLLRPDQWQAARDLALVALASYPTNSERKQDPESKQEAEEVNE